MLWAVAGGLNLLSGIGRYQQDKYQHRYRLQVSKARARYAKGVAYNSAILAEQEATDVLRSGRKARQLLGRKAAHTISGIRAGMASSGFTMDGGDAYRIADDARTLHREDATEMRRQTRRRAGLLRYKAAMTRHAADYNLKMASHDPGGPSFGRYFINALTGTASQMYAAGAFDDFKLPSFGSNPYVSPGNPHR